MFGNVFEYEVVGIMYLKTSILSYICNQFLSQKIPEINVRINESLCVIWSLYMKLYPLLLFTPFGPPKPADRRNWSRVLTPPPLLISFLTIIFMFYFLLSLRYIKPGKRINP